MAKTRGDLPDENKENSEIKRIKRSLVNGDRILSRKQATKDVKGVPFQGEGTISNKAYRRRVGGERGDQRIASHAIEGKMEREHAEKRHTSEVSKQYDAQGDYLDRIVEHQKRSATERHSLNDKPSKRDTDVVRNVYVDTSITEITNISASTRTIEEELRYKGSGDGAHSAYAHRQVQGEMGEVMAKKYLEQQGYRPISPHDKSADHGLDHIAWSPDGKRLFIGESKNHDSTSGLETGDRKSGDKKGIFLDDHSKVRSALEVQSSELPKKEREAVLKAFDEGRVERGVFLYGDTRPASKLVERAQEEGWTIYQLKPRVKTYDRVSSRDEV